MFFVLNKDRIMTVLVTCSTIFILFLMTSLFAKTPENAITTSSNKVENNIINNWNNNDI